MNALRALPYAVKTGAMVAVKAASFIYGRLRQGYPLSNTLYGFPRFDNLTDPWPRTSYNRTGDTLDLNASAGDVSCNSAVVICLGKIANVFPEPRLEVVERQSDGTWKPIEDHPALDLLSEPNQLDDFGSLSTAWAMSYKVDGNSYFILTRSRGGQPVQIDYVNPDQIRPESESKRVAIERYVYSVDGDEIPYSPTDVIHWRDGKDRNNPRLGQSRLKKLVGEIASDNEATTYTAAILHNMGIVGGMLTSDDPEAMPATPEQVEKIRAHWRDKTTGAHRGDIIVPTWKAKYQDIGRSPEQMALDKIRQVPEARIAAVLDVPAAVAGLVASGEPKYANYAEAREAFWEECVVPLHTRFCGGLTRYLLPQFGDQIRGAKRRRFRYNYDEVKAFQPDMDKQSARKTKEWLADGITLNEYREGVGEKELPEGEGKVFYSQHTGEMKQAFAPDPLPGADPNAPESAGDLVATRDNAVGRTMPFGSKKAVEVAAGLNGHHLPATGAGKALTLTDADGSTYVATEADTSQVAEMAFGDLESFWAKRRERWAKEIEGEEEAE